MSHWISVDEQLPEPRNGVSSAPVLVVKDCGPGSLPSMDVTFAWSDEYLSKGKRWHIEEGSSYRVTHWMPLPELPQ